MNIILDGVSGVGKTYYGNLLARKHDLSFLTFLPHPNDFDEVTLHEYVINRQQQYNAPFILEGSILMSEFTKMWMYQKNYLSLKELMQILSLDKSKVAPYGIIYLTDLPENIKARRLKRGRPYEYLPGLTDLSSIDSYIRNKFLEYAKRVPVVTVSVTNKSDDEVITELEHAIFTIITQ